MIDPVGEETNFQYDELNRLSRTIDGELRPTDRLYDTVGRLFRVIDALGQIREEYAYHPNGKVESLKDAGTNVTNYEYDEFDRLKRTIYPDLSDEVLSYDAAGKTHLGSNALHIGSGLVFCIQPRRQGLSAPSPGRYFRRSGSAMAIAAPG